MLGDLLRAFQARLSPGKSAIGARLAAIDSWLADMPLPEAKTQAIALIAHTDWFTTEPGPVSLGSTAPLPSGVQELFERYASVRGRFSDLVLVATEVRASTVEPSLLHVGWDDAHVELCTNGADEAVYRLATDVPSSEAREGSSLSIWHAILRMGAVLEYVMPPAPAA